MNRRPPGAAPSHDAAGENERLLYGRLLSSVRFLRQRGFGVHREGDRYRVGNRLMDAGQLQRIAARERRLVAEGQLVATRRLIGGS